MSDLGRTARDAHGAGAPRSRAGARAPFVIDGEAEVTGRTPRHKTAAERQAALERPAFTAFSQSAEAEAAVPYRPFGRRKTEQPGAATPGGPAARRPQSRDLIWQAMAAAQGPGSSDGPEDGAATVAAKRRVISPAQALLAAGAFILGLALIPTFLLSFPSPSIAARALDTPGSAIKVENVSASTEPRGESAVLSVEGTISNASDSATSAPLLRIAFRHPDGTVHEKPFIPAVALIGPHESIGFVSRIAVPAGTTGDISVGLAPQETASP
ncbi:hypothetical protein [Jiella sp. M17.18]|uniref:hypothetical protein n=1 Tax=Jiella sp. M17.18 TaxID=3234247 RepID=UPI0034DEBD6E